MKYKVLDENGDEVEGRGPRTGLLAVTSPSTMSRYYLPVAQESDKATKQVIRGSWLYTGDLVTLEGEYEDLRLDFLGRRSDILMDERDYLFPQSIDQALRGHAGVQEAAGFIVKDALSRLVFACAVVKVPGTAGNEKRILDWCKSRLPGKAAPALVVFIDVLPRDAGGNINRSRLTRLYSGISTV